jgi:hypothetical protein
MAKYLFDDWRRRPPWWCADRPTWQDGLPSGRAGVEALSEDFVARRREPASLLAQRRDDIVDYCAEADTLYTAVTRACMSRRPNGRVHNHQSRVPEQVRAALAVMLIERMCGVAGAGEAWDWDELWVLLATCQEELSGVGPVFAYDVAVRVGAWLGVKPSDVFCKAGTLAGTRALQRVVDGEVDVVDGEWIATGWYSRRGMGKVVRAGGADMLEDALCSLREPLLYLADCDERR